MARKKKRRSYGSGCVLTKPDGRRAIRWRESVLMPDGTIQRQLRYEMLGVVSVRQATEELRDRQAAAQVLRRAPLTFEELAKAWEKTVLPMYKYSTRKHHAHILKKKLLPFFGSIRIDQISRQQVQQFIAELNNRSYSPNSIDHWHGVLSTILTKAVQWGYVSNNPAAGVQLPRLVAVRPKVALTPDQAAQLLAHLQPMPRAIVALAIITGVRRGELFALRWKGFDRGKGTLYVHEAIYENVIDRPKTEKSTRLIPLSQQAIQLLSSWYEVSSRQAPEDFIFSRANGGPKDQKQIMRDHIAPACRAIGIPRASWLTFRRTFATWADQQGVSPKQRGELMGNSAEINQNVYTQVMDHPLRMAVERVSGELFTNCSLEQGWVN
jgi:integrase